MRALPWAVFGAIALACSAPPAPSAFKTDKSKNNGGADGTDESGVFGRTNNPEGGAPKSFEQPPCDGALASDGSAETFARAIGICTTASKEGYGLVSAQFTQGHGRDDAPNVEQHGVLAKFGAVIRPREGKMLGVLSTGYAREFDGPAGNEPFGGVMPPQGEYGKDWNGAKARPGNGTAPPGFPKPAANCPQDNRVNDLVSLALTLKAPEGASGFAFDFDFYSSEWPAYICSRFNDGFVAYLTTKAFTGNISFDKDRNPVSVNNGFFDRCTPNAQVGCAGPSPKAASCPGGEAELVGTGFGYLGSWCSAFGASSAQSVNGGATGWLTSSAPVAPGETFRLELMIWDTGDGVLDSSVLLDHFRWLGGAVETTTDRPR